MYGTGIEFMLQLITVTVTAATAVITYLQLRIMKE
jgi:hypothetical protein